MKGSSHSLDTFYRGFLLSLASSIDSTCLSLTGSSAHRALRYCLERVDSKSPLYDASSRILADTNPIFDRNAHLFRLEAQGARDFILEIEDRTSYFILSGEEAYTELSEIRDCGEYIQVATSFLEEYSR